MSLEPGWAEDVIRETEAKQGFKFNPEQRRAVYLPCESGLGVLTGGAGVGKTAMLRVIRRTRQSPGDLRLSDGACGAGSPTDGRGNRLPSVDDSEVHCVGSKRQGGCFRKQLGCH